MDSSILRNERIAHAVGQERGVELLAIVILGIPVQRKNHASVLVLSGRPDKSYDAILGT